MKNKLQVLIFSVFFFLSFSLVANAQTFNVGNMSSYIQYLSEVLNNMIQKYKIAAPTVNTNQNGSGGTNVTDSGVISNIKDPNSVFTINNLSSGLFKVGDKWTLKLITNNTSFANRKIMFCASQNNGAESCSYADELKGRSYFPLKGYTDSNGNWEATGVFDSESDVGKWTQYVKLVDSSGTKKNIGSVVKTDNTASISISSCINISPNTYCVPKVLSTPNNGDIVRVVAGNRDWRGYILVWRNGSWTMPIDGDIAILEDNLIYVYKGLTWVYAPGITFYGIPYIGSDSLMTKEWFRSSSKITGVISVGGYFETASAVNVGEIYYSRDGGWMKMGSNGVGTPINPPFAKFGYVGSDAVDVKMSGGDFVSNKINFELSTVSGSQLNQNKPDNQINPLPPILSGSFSINNQISANFNVSDKWNIKLITNNSSLANKRVSVCVRDPLNTSKTTSCSYADELKGRSYFPLKGYTDSNGNWEATGVFDSELDVGKWVEYVKVGNDEFVSNNIIFLVFPGYSVVGESSSNKLYINSQSGGNFKVGDKWSLKLWTNVPSLANKRVQICTKDPLNTSKTTSCSYTDELKGRSYFPLVGKTDMYGNWYANGVFDSISDVGKWVQYVKVGNDELISTDINFLVFPN